MKIVNNKPYVPVMEYEIGDVIQGNNRTLFMVVKSDDSQYMMIDLENGQGTPLYDSLCELYENEHIGGEHKVLASVMIDENAV